MNNIHGTPTSGHGGSDRRGKHECPCCETLTMGVPHHDGGYYLRCPNCLSKYFGGGWVFNEEDQYATLKQVKPILHSILAVVVGITLGSILAVTLWLITR